MLGNFRVQGFWLFRVLGFAGLELRAPVRGALRKDLLSAVDRGSVRFWHYFSVFFFGIEAQGVFSALGFAWKACVVSPVNLHERLLQNMFTPSDIDLEKGLASAGVKLLSGVCASVYVCVYIHIYIYIHTYIYIYTHIHRSLSLSLVQIHTDLHPLTHTHIYIYIHIHT